MKDWKWLKKAERIVSLAVTVIDALRYAFGKSDPKEKWKKIKNHLIEREGVVDRNGVLLSKGVLKSFDGKEISIKKDFNSKAQIGRAKLRYKPGEGLYADLYIPKDYPVEGRYPATKVWATHMVKGEHPNKKEEITVVERCQDMFLTIMSSENADLGIKPLRVR